MKCVSLSKISGKEIYNTIFSISLVTIMLCSKLHCQKSFKSKHIAYKITTLTPEPRPRNPAPPPVGGVTYFNLDSWLVLGHVCTQYTRFPSNLNVGFPRLRTAQCTQRTGPREAPDLPPDWPGNLNV